MKKKLRRTPENQLSPDTYSSKRGGLRAMARQLLRQTCLVRVAATGFGGSAARSGGWAGRGEAVESESVKTVKSGGVRAAARHAAAFAALETCL